MRLVPALALVCALLAAVPTAEGGGPIKKVATCDNAVTQYAPTTRTQFRAAVLCLINSVRKSQHLPALKRNAKLETVAQSQSKTSGGHGKTLAEIGKRFEKKGYKPAAYNEAFSFIDAPELPTPYGFLMSMMSKKTVPCSEVLDPRFRDVGVGISPIFGGQSHNLTLEFGLKQGAKQPSNDYTKAASCPHKVPS